jgi:RNA polymerase sigma-70 factor (sigma-E family)
VEVTQAPTWADLVAARLPALRRLAVMLTGETAQAEDLVQSALAKAHRHADRIVEMAAPAAYLRRALVNEHLSWRRRQRRTPAARPLSEDDSHVVDPTGAVDLRDQTWRLLATLPRQQRAVLALRYYEDLTDAEIADLLGCSTGTVRSHASRALAVLRERLHEEES